MCYHYAKLSPLHTKQYNMAKYVRQLSMHWSTKYTRNIAAVKNWPNVDIYTCRWVEILIPFGFCVSNPGQIIFGSWSVSLYCFVPFLSFT